MKPNTPLLQCSNIPMASCFSSGTVLQRHTFFVSKTQHSDIPLFPNMFQSGTGQVSPTLQKVSEINRKSHQKLSQTPG
jgi:hypothetical protein